MNVLSRTGWIGAAAGICLAAYLLGALSHARDWWPMETLRAFKRQLVGPADPRDSEEAAAAPRSHDAFQRLVSPPTPKIVVPCPAQDDSTLVLLLIGQSNAGNFHGQRHASAHGDRVLNHFDGRCYVAESPLLGTSGNQGEAWTRLGNRLVSSGRAGRVILVPAAIAASPVARWQAGGDLNAMLLEVLAELRQHYRVTHVLWHQGEQDWFDRTASEEYSGRFVSLVESLRAAGVGAPVFVSVASRCGPDPAWSPDNAVAAAQRALPDPQRGIFAGPDTDRLLGYLDRHDGCHFAGSGVEKFVEAWVGLLSPDLAVGSPE